jgi:Carboxypeptidase regulatory-like domain
MRAAHSLAIALTALTATIAVPTGASAGQGRGVPEGPPGTVTLPVGDYDRLLDRAAQPPSPANTPPVPAVVGRAEIRARVDGDAVRGTLQLDGEVFQRGAVKVPLVSGATLLDARLDGGPLPVLHEGDVHAAIFNGPAPFSVALDWAAALGTSPGRASFALPQAACGSVSAIIDLPGDPAEVRVEPGIVIGRQTTAGRTTIEVTLERGRRTQVSWSVRESATQGAPAESRVLSDVKSLVTIGDGDLRMVALVDVTVVRGDPRTLDIQVPAGYEVGAITGSSLESSDTRGSVLTLTVRDPARRRHQFLLSLEQPHAPGSFKVDTAFPTVTGAQREAGETAIEGTGTIEVNASADDTLRRMDVRETNASLRSLARQPLLAAFRYQRRPNDTRILTLDVKRFQDAAVIAAAADRALATTLVTSEGRTLTEVTLQIRNRAQPFMKVTLPPGATMLSVDVGGETAKPVVGSDGTRIPLMRTAFRPDGPYTVSFVYLHPGQAFTKRGDARMSLPTFDVPVSVLEWELFLPGQYSAKPIGGNVIPADMLAQSSTSTVSVAAYLGPGSGGGVGGGVAAGIGGISNRPAIDNAGPGQIVGRITDPTGSAMPGVTVTVTGPANERLTGTSDAEGFYVIHGVPSGTISVSSEMAGFSTARRSLPFDQRARRIDFRMELGGVHESVAVTAENAANVQVNRQAQNQSGERTQDALTQVAPSPNVINLQRRVAGVLPVRVDVPRAGTQYRFVRPLVLEEETTVSFRYRTR